MQKEYSKSTDKIKSIDAKIHALMLDLCGMQKNHWARMRAGEDISYLNDLQRLQKGVIQMHKLVTNKASYRQRWEGWWYSLAGRPAQPWLKSLCFTFGKQQLLCSPLAHPFAVMCTKNFERAHWWHATNTFVWLPCTIPTPQKSQHYGKGAVPPALCCTSILHQSWECKALGWHK